MKTYHVYIVECADSSYYTGITNDLDRRLDEHNNGIDVKSYTYKRIPVKLVFSTEFHDVNQAIAFEKQVKGWSRKKKEAIINDEWEKLPELSQNRCHSNNKGRSADSSTSSE
ncbi:GIY-YIG nuclease family protein [Sphingobacterium wenxiniae]|uniref:Putative endonuclease n=1 Tax=Sphingobacterium wenxiniae TaxID=683125 RepID=A0A1I6UNC3_9SPHI|nr:GIY-YIG nuclease family protein [Sphingobacterium wenxiniae]SFT02950.1 putative endonuclease [Sphingobacterium wenxiniae]